MYLAELAVLDALHFISQILLVPVIVVLIVLAALTVVILGMFVVESFTERRRLKRAFPAVFLAVQGADFDDIASVVERSNLLSRQKNMLADLVDHASLGSESLAARAKEALLSERVRRQKTLAWTDLMSRVAPMFGLMGTLIPLGPGILAMSQGDTTTLANSMLIAFDTTVAGLITAAICLVVSRIRRMWYDAGQQTFENIMITILEKIELRDASLTKDASPAVDCAVSKGE